MLRQQAFALTAVGILGLGPAMAHNHDVVALVNGAGIPRDRLQSEVDTSVEESGLNYGGFQRPQQYEQMRRQTLKLLIAEELLRQTAETHGFVAESGKVDLASSEVQSDFPSQYAPAARVERADFDVESFNESVRQRISIRRWAHEALGATIEISDAGLLKLSGITRTGFGFHIIDLIDHREG